MHPPLLYVLSTVLWILPALRTIASPTICPEVQSSTQRPIRNSFHRRDRAGDIRLGLLAPILTPSGPDPRDCNRFDIRRGGVFLRVEAFLFSLQKHKFRLELRNATGHGDESISVGYLIGDTCDSNLMATEVALDAARSSPSKSAREFSQRVCKTTETGWIQSDRLVGVIGPTTNNLVDSLSPLLSAIGMPHVSPGPNAALGSLGCGSYVHEFRSALGKRDCNYEREFFFRTVSPDSFLIYAVLDLIEKMSWWHFVLLSDSSLHNRALLRKVQKEVSMRKENRTERGLGEKYCVAFAEYLPEITDSLDVKKETHRRIVEKLSSNTKAQVVVLLSSVQPAVQLFKYINTYEKGKPIPRMWIGSEWGQDPDIYNMPGLTNVTLAGFLTLWPGIPVVFKEFIQPLVKGLVERSNLLTVRHAREAENWWLCLDWAVETNCLEACKDRFPGVCYSEALSQSCNETIPFKKIREIPVENVFLSATTHTIFATEIMLQALTDIWQEINKQPQLSSKTFDDKRDAFLSMAHGKKLSSAIQRVRLPCGRDLSSWCRVFPASDGGADEHDQSHEIAPIYLLVTVNDEKLHDIGSWQYNLTTKSGSVHIDSHLKHVGILSQSLKTDPRTGFPLSDCRKDCPDGSVPVPEGRCCWHCNPCLERSYANSARQVCEVCPQGEQPDSNHSSCVPLPFHKPRSYYIGMVLSLALVLVNLAILCGTFIAMVKGKASVAIKSSDSQLSKIMLFGMIGATLSLVIFHLSPTKGICTAARLVLLPCLLLTVSTTLVKTSRVARLWLHAKSARRTQRKFTLSTNLQVSLIALITAFGLVTELGFVYGMGTDTEIVYTTESVYRVCSADLYQLATNCLIILPMFITSLLAFTIRKMRSIANESQRLFMASLCICMTWIVLTPTYYLSPNYRPTVLSLAVIGHVMSLWCWLFLPRLYWLRKSDSHLRSISRASAGLSIYSISPSYYARRQTASSSSF